MMQYRVRMQSNRWFVFYYNRAQFSHGDGPFNKYDDAIAAGKASGAVNGDEA